jgi:hypothetical protein
MQSRIACAMRRKTTLWPELGRLKGDDVRRLGDDIGRGDDISGDD